MKLLDRYGEWWLHRRGLCTHTGLRSCLPKPPIIKAGVLTQEMILNAIEKVNRGGPIHADYPWASPVADVFRDMRETMDDIFASGEGVFTEQWKMCPDHGTAMIRHEPSDDWACTLRGCRFYHGLKTPWQ